MEALAGLIQEEAVPFVAAVGMATGAGASKFGLEVKVDGGIRLGFGDKSVVQPILRFVIADGAAAFEAIGDEKVEEGIVVKIKGGATPGPTGAGDVIAQDRLFETAVLAREVESVAVHHAERHGTVFGDIGAPEVEVLEAVDGGGGHADHEEIETAIGVEISDGMGHTESAGIRDPGIGDIGELAHAVIEIKVDAGEVADDDEIEMAIGVEICERGAVNAAPAFGSEVGGLGGVGEFAVATINEEISGMAVVGIVVRGRQGAAFIGDPVLAKENVKVSIRIDIAGRESHGIVPAGWSWEYESPGLGKGDLA